MTALAVPWEPEWAAVFPDDKLAMEQEHRPFLHKALYLRSDMALPSDLPADVIMRDLEQGGLFLPAELV